jgi:hypothetical protein
MDKVRLDDLSVQELKDAYRQLHALARRVVWDAAQAAPKWAASRCCQGRWRPSARSWAATD